MKKDDGKKRYTRPAVLSEKVFEQAALACEHVAFATAVPAPVIPNQRLKASTTVCTISSS